MTAAYKIEPSERGRGWCIEVRHRTTRPDGTVVDHPSYWYGPTHGWGTTSGPMSDDPGGLGWSWYRTRADALAAKRGSPIAGRRAYQPRRVADALAEQAERRARREATR